MSNTDVVLAPNGFTVATTRPAASYTVVERFSSGSIEPTWRLAAS
ncbi:MAG: hypothetical protein ACK5EA_18605 [Planctomycetaceae bacterium]